MNNYDHKRIEKKWQERWQKNEMYKTKEEGDKCYILDMFPYPSGQGLHVGHPKGYIATDVYSRFKRMNRFSVLHPMGFDAFGLPAENFAIKNKTNPKIAVTENVKRYKEQLEIFGFDYDWDREINTTDPDYYKWTQWIFIQLFKKGLAYESNEPINWCPSCKTGLANEDLEDGRCERCGSEVEKKPMRQWVLKITDYADRLLKDIEDLDWPDSIKESQKNWIGRSEGSEIDFKVNDKEIKVFTTRPDTLFGTTYVVLAPEHKLIHELEDKVENLDEVRKYIKESRKKSEIERTAEDKEKTGVELKGIRAINPANKEEIPVWIADYVLPDYGTGAVMAVPAHDQRDYEFAKKFDLPIKQVIAPFFVDPDNPPEEGKEWSPRRNIMLVVKHPTEEKIIQLKWKKVPWKTFVIGGVEDNETYEEGALRELKEETGFKNIKSMKQLGWQMESHFFAKHKDVNRRAFPKVFWVELEDLEQDELSEEETEKHEVTWVPLEGFPRDYWPVCELPEIQAHIEKGDHAYTGEGVLINSGEFDGSRSEEAREKITEFVGGEMSIRYKLRDWVFSRQRYWGEPIPIVHCDKCGPTPVPEEDLPIRLPNVESYEPTGTGESPLAKIEDWVNTKCPKCGGKAKRETNTMPQWAGSSWYYLRYMDPKNDEKLVSPEKEELWDPVDMYVGGAEHATRHLIYARFWHKFLYDIGVVSKPEPFIRLQHVGLIMAEDGRKMSKRWNNVVNPDDIVERLGADSLRVYEMFMGPFDQAIAWSTENIAGARRFLERVWNLFDKSDSSTDSVGSILHKTIKKVGEDVEKFRFNTAISTMMKLVNEFDSQDKVSKKDFGSFLKILSPFAPHLTEELWEKLGNKESIHISDWPEYDENELIEEVVSIAVQVNGKVRGTVDISPQSSEEEAVELAKKEADIAKWLENKEIKKIIYQPGKILSFVV